MTSLAPSPSDHWRFLYRARWMPDKYMDGDTFTVLLDKGIMDYSRVALRINGLWCPERYTEEGKRATMMAREWLSRPSGLEWPLLVELHKAPSDEEEMSFTRYIADVFDETMSSFAEDMIALGLGWATRAEMKAAQATTT